MVIVMIATILARAFTLAGRSGATLHSTQRPCLLASGGGDDDDDDDGAPRYGLGALSSFFVAIRYTISMALAECWWVERALAAANERQRASTISDRSMYAQAHAPEHIPFPFAQGASQERGL